MDSGKRAGETGGVATAAGSVAPAGGASVAAPAASADVAAAAGSADPEVGLRAVAALRVLTERLEILQVDNARRLGWSWQEIAERLGVTKQTVHRKHGGRSREQR
jgi:DNA-binding NarL/FixJ family response regulator